MNKKNHINQTQFYYRIRNTRNRIDTNINSSESRRIKKEERERRIKIDWLNTKYSKIFSLIRKDINANRINSTLIDAEYKRLTS